jgi:type IV pilus assembly protein PilQ
MSIKTSLDILTSGHPAANAQDATSRRAPLMLGLLAFATLVSSAVTAATLDNVSYISLPGDRVQVKMKLSAPVEGAPLSFTIDNPARIAIDLPGTTLNLKERTQRIGVGNAESVTAVEAENRARVVLNLGQLVPYDIETNGDTISVTLEGGASSLATQSPPMAPTAASVAQAAPAPSAPPAASSAPTMPGNGKGSIRDIDFRRGANGQAQIIVDLSAPDLGVNVSQKGDDVVVDFANTALPENLDRKLDVLDFATPAKEIDTFREGNGTRMVIKPNGLYEHLAYQSDNTFTIELRPLTKEEEVENKKKKFGYTGERLSLNFQNIEVRAVLQLIADFTEKNLVASDTVGGNVTLRLKNVPWDQALDIILKSRGLDKREIGNVMMVAPQEEIANREKLEMESKKQVQELAPIRTEFMQVNYAKAADIATLLKQKTAGAKGKNENLLSSRGSVSVDERTNTLLVQDTGDKLTEIRNLIHALDVPVRQVLIESRIVIANEDFSKNLGVRFGYSKGVQPESGQNPRNRGGMDAFLGGGLAGDVKYSENTAFHTDDLENYMVDLAAPGAAGAAKLAVGKIGSYLLQLELSALQQEGKGEVISAPRVITANQHEAIIESGTEIPYLEASSSGATAVSFKKAVLSLKVTPQITPDNRLIMDLAVNKDSVGQIFSGIPSIDTNELTTQVLVDDGDTVVLGGIFESENRDDKTSVPWFGDLPYLGRLFKRTGSTASKQELLVFVTPKIIKETLSLSKP